MTVSGPARRRSARACRAFRLALPLLALTPLVGGCYRTVVRSGAPVVEEPGAVHTRWHHAFLLGAIDASGTYDLRELCPGGWGELEVHSEFLQGLISVASLLVYTPQTVTVYCAAPGSPPAVVPSGVGSAAAPK